MAQFTKGAGRAIVAATLFGAFLSTVPLHESRAQQTDQPAKMAMTHAKHAIDRSEARITELHDKLHITAAQEQLWSAVAQTMRDTGKRVQAAMADRSAKLKTMSAIDDLKSYQAIADLHADSLKQLIPAFQALYDAMTPEQQKHADHVFGEHQRHAHLSHM